LNITEKYPYIVIEGPIGSGKTTLAKRLADRFSVNLLLENAGANPFLPRFYQDAARFALPTQLFFLFQRAEQVRDLSQRDLFGTATVADFFLEKDPLFARLNLGDEEYALYRQIYQHLQVQTTMPDLVIYLQTPAETLLKRVEQRNVSYEQGIPREYLERLAEAYSDFFHHYDASPLLIVNNENLDCASDEAAMELLLGRIGAMRGRREYFNPRLGG
jgi:deoxyadenosine/deoxycytidine kinase